MKKVRIGKRILDVTTSESYRNNEAMYDTGRTAIEYGNYVLPVLNRVETLSGIPGFIPGSFVNFYRLPTEDNTDNQEEYKIENVIDYSEATTMREIINKQSMVKDLEKELLINSDCITIPKIDDNDSVEMIALKQAIAAKECDLNNYAPRFNGNYANDKRILNDNTITLAKMKKYGNALDMKISLTIEDANPNVPNPMGTSITVELTGGDSDE